MYWFLNSVASFFLSDGYLRDHSTTICDTVSFISFVCESPAPNVSLGRLGTGATRKLGTLGTFGGNEFHLIITACTNSTSCVSCVSSLLRRLLGTDASVGDSVHAFFVPYSLSLNDLNLSGNSAWTSIQHRQTASRQRWQNGANFELWDESGAMTFRLSYSYV